VVTYDIVGIKKLIASLRGDFNGDFLSVDPESSDLWDVVDRRVFPLLGNFLSRVDIASGQLALWNYDFSFIPVELLSGIYESFIGDDKQAIGAYYTPRQLANLVVDLAFASSKDPLRERIYDGACGSGILLTTAFRRMIGFAEARKGEQLTLGERVILLQEHIFGGDINKMACKVTAFSLYLSLLEDLEPSDILALQENENVKLPPLHNANLFSGKDKGDFFSDENPLSSSRRFSLVISNPPWREPKRNERTSADNWAESAAGVTRSRRQMAGDFAFRAADCLAENGRMCLIMPTSLFLAPTSQEFISGWLLKNRIHQLVNFGDLMNFIFETAEHSCAVVHASPRQADTVLTADEMIDYWAPKADTSIAFGRLTLASGDRHRVQAQTYFADCSILVTLMWGNTTDIALVKRLQWCGTFREMTTGPRARWVSRKGFHKKDVSVEKPASTEPLKAMPYLKIDALKRGLPVVLAADLCPFPSDITEVAKLDDSLMKVFKGPRIVFPDGFDSRLEIRASYIDVPASFNSSIGVIRGSNEDADLLRFAAVYLRSDLIKYFLLMSAYQVACDRNRVTLKNIDDFPFVAPENHHFPEQATQIVHQVSEFVQGLDNGDLLQPDDAYSQTRAALNELIFEYFGLTEHEKLLVKETVRELVPSVRPRGYASLYTRLQHRACTDQLRCYTYTLERELQDWQSALDGQGSIRVHAVSMEEHLAGPIGVVCIELDANQPKEKVVQNNKAVVEILKELRNSELLPAPLSEDLYFSPDTIIWTERSLYMARPLTRRFWLHHAAVRDARRIVTETHHSSEMTENA